MDRRSKIIVITATLIMWVLVGSIVGVGVYFGEKFEEQMEKFEEDSALFMERLEGEGVISGDELFSKTVLNEEVLISNITDIFIRPKTPLGEGEIILAGSNGAIFLDLDDPSVVNSSVYFEDDADFVEVIDVEGDGVEEFMGRGCWCKPPIVIDSAGETIWKYDRAGDKVVDMVAADMDGDGELEFVSALRDGGLRIIDRNDKKIFKKKTSPVRHLEVADVDGDGRLDIIFTTIGGQVMVVDSLGKWLSTVKDTEASALRDSTELSSIKEDELEVGDFTLVARPEVDGEEFIVSVADGAVRFHDLFGKVVKEVSIERAYGSTDIRGVGFESVGENAYVAVLLVYTGVEKSVLLVFDEDLSLVYEEVFEGLYYAIAKEPARVSDGAETLLIGGQGGLIRYALTDGTELQ
ncbi:MAG: VCBS repeat-containing protein [Deltaproteobacteria bacterium]|nr:VCBS repeat-containing protein [Deltaproteobacteria bacterium]